MAKFPPLLILLGFFLFILTPAVSSEGSFPVTSEVKDLSDSWTNTQGEEMLAWKTMDLSTRHKVPSVNKVFSDNILLNLHYLKGDVENLKDSKGKINWEKTREPFNFTLTLEPDQTFAYHRTLLAEFKRRNVLAGNSRFLASEGYKSDGYLFGDGICHLATLFNWVSQEAGFEVKAKVNHDFLPVPEVPREFGTSIFYTPDGSRNSANQNLYVTNNFSFPVTFLISADEKMVEIKISKAI